MPLTLTAQNAFDAVLKFGSVFGAYAVPGKAFQIMSSGNLLKYSVYAAISGSVASLGVKINPALEGGCPCDRETAEKIRAFFLRWTAGALPFCVYIWNSNEISVLAIIGSSLPFLFAFEVASELLSHYIRCCPERVIVQRIALREAQSPGSFISASGLERNSLLSHKNSIDNVPRIVSRSDSPEPGSVDFNGHFDESDPPGSQNLSSRNSEGEV